MSSGEEREEWGITGGGREFETEPDVDFVCRLGYERVEFRIVCRSSTRDTGDVAMVDGGGNGRGEMRMLEGRLSWF